MNITGIGKDIDDEYLGGHLDRLDHYLAHVQALGYTVAELGIPGLGVIVNGQLRQQRVNQVLAVLSRYDLKYTVHAPNRTNLAYGYDHDLERCIVEACLQFCGQIGAPVLVYHSGLHALDAAQAGIAPLPDDAELKRGEEREVLALRELAKVAADMGVTICMENADTHQWEYALLAKNGKSPEELPKFHARLRIPPIVQQLEAINHPNVRITLDFAHLHIATHALGIDYLEAVEQAAPWVKHLHMNDNFGKVDVGFESELDCLPYGEADLHLPLGWGSIPLKEALQKLPDYEGIIILEIKEPYRDHFGEALQTARNLIDSVRSQ